MTDSERQRLEQILKDLELNLPLSNRDTAMTLAILIKLALQFEELTKSIVEEY